MWVYFVLPLIIGKVVGSKVNLSPEVAAVLGLGVAYSGFLSETVRAGLRSVSYGQTEAALSLGMMPRAVLFQIVLPQALRRVLPMLGSQAVVIVKDTSIASTIAVAELTHTGKLLLDRSAAPYETFLAIALIYLAVTAATLGVLRLVAIRFPVRA